MRLLLSYAAALLLALPAAGCGGEHAPRAQVQTFVDDLGRTVALERPVTRVLTLAPNLTEIVYAAGGGSRLAGASLADDYPPAVDTLPRFSVFPVDFERIVALAPDLVLATDQVNSSEDAATLGALGLPTYFFSFSSLGDVLEAIRKVGDLLGTQALADAAADSLARAVDALRARTALAAERPLVLFLIDDETLHAFGRESYVHDLIALAGGRSATTALDTRAPILSEEYVLTQKPAVIIGAFGGAYDPDRLRTLHPSWQLVPAVRDGRVYSIDGSLVHRPGPRLVEGAQRMARLLHPELFAAAAEATP